MVLNLQARDPGTEGCVQFQSKSNGLSARNIDVVISCWKVGGLKTLEELLLHSWPEAW